MRVAPAAQNDINQESQLRTSPALYFLTFLVSFYHAGYDVRRARMGRRAGQDEPQKIQGFFYKSI